MGVSLSWMGVRGRPKEDVLSELGFADTGKVLEGPDFAHFAWGVTDAGWLIIHALDMKYVTAKRLESISRGGEAVGFIVEEHVLVSAARAFSDGRSTWAVIHDEDDDCRARVWGPPPEPYWALHARLARLQAEDKATPSRFGPVDYMFDAPMDIAETVCLFRHDGNLDYWPTFTKLEPLPTMTEEQEKRLARERVDRRKRFFGWLYKGQSDD